MVIEYSYEIYLLFNLVNGRYILLTAIPATTKAMP